MTSSDLALAVFPRRVVAGLGRRYSPVGGRIVYLLREFRQYLTGSTLDIGAGNAGLQLGEALGPTYHALDIGDSYKIVSDSERGGLRFVADLEKQDIPIEDASYDTLLCLDVLEHVDDPHRVYAELFRLARRNVIISLPNNWPSFYWSFLAGRNVTHSAGYGLSSIPKRPGERHKYFFNIEEAFEFLTQRVPYGFEVRRVDCVFEHGSDGLISSHPRLAPIFRMVGRARVEDARQKMGWIGVPVWIAAKALVLPVRVLDILLSALLAGWGNRTRFYNLFCRQLWVVYERSDGDRVRDA